MLSLVRKARYVAGGHRTDPPKESVYSSVVSCDSVRLRFWLAAINDVDILDADIQNACLEASTKEKVYIVAGPEFGSDEKRPAKIVRALYGLKSSGARFRDSLVSVLRDMHFKSCLADPDVHMRPAVKPNGENYWEYVLCYVDDVLVISHQTKIVMEGISRPLFRGED